jgi:hypothetical protein
MSCVGQDEIVIILECLPDEATVPKDIFSHLNTLYQDAARGKSSFSVQPSFSPQFFCTAICFMIL